MVNKNGLCHVYISFSSYTLTKLIFLGQLVCFFGVTLLYWPAAVFPLLPEMYQMLRRCKMLYVSSSSAIAGSSPRRRSFLPRSLLLDPGQIKWTKIAFGDLHKSLRFTTIGFENVTLPQRLHRWDKVHNSSKKSEPGLAEVAWCEWPLWVPRSEAWSKHQSKQTLLYFKLIATCWDLRLDLYSVVHVNHFLSWFVFFQPMKMFYGNMTAGVFWNGFIVKKIIELHRSTMYLLYRLLTIANFCKNMSDMLPVMTHPEGPSHQLH